MEPITIDGNIIVEGHHRFISAKLCKQEPPRKEGTLAPHRKGIEYPLKNIEISPNDFGNR